MAENLPETPYGNTPIFDGLLQEFGPEFAAELAATSETAANENLGEHLLEIEQRLDYDALVAAVAQETPTGVEDSEKSNTLYEQSLLFMTTRRTRREGNMLSVEEAQHVGETLAGYETQWDQNGLLLRGRQALLSDDEAQRMDDEANIFLHAVHDMLHRTATLNNRYGLWISPDGPKMSLLGRQFRRLTMLLIASDSSGESDVTNPLLASAIEKYIEKQLPDLPSYYVETGTDSKFYETYTTEARQIEAKPLVDALEITGSWQIPHMPDQSVIRGFIEKNIPPIAIQQVKKIEFRNLTNEEKELAQPFNPAGILKMSDSGESTIVISVECTQEYVDSLAKQGVPPHLIEAKVKDCILYYVAHEYAHAFHSLLPASALEHWENTIASDDVNITAYVQATQDLGKDRDHAERIADAVAMYAIRPQDLQVISEATFNAVQRLYADFHPEHESLKTWADLLIRISSQLLQDGGVSRSSYRASLLVHQHKIDSQP
ncbi:MAG TPA: hypothetical protein VGO07_01380 [Candidatus Saccharimonadales bacterium]|jgi:hypothetical protein|nr:hypothetical protein [Candidatus Saccharimonadales bacterium]